MKRYQWILAIGVIAAATIIGSCKTKFETTKSSYNATRSESAFDRGEVLVYSICAGCHYDRTAHKFIGTQIHEVPGIVGKVYAANLTHSKSHGVLSRYSDAELKYLLKTGIARDGRFIPYMLRPNMADQDLNDMIVYLRSDAPAVAAADTTIGITHFTLVGKMAMNMMAKPLPYKTGMKRPAENDSIAAGRYLVDNIGCFHCHSKSLTKLNYLNPEQSKGYMAGGIRFKTPVGVDIYAANLTPDKQTGIGNYSRLQFRKAVKDGESPSGKLHPPMPEFKKLNDRDIDLMYAYLQAIPAKYHKVPGH
jgi:mono/diheme cytochrome c family protein